MRELNSARISLGKLFEDIDFFVSSEVAGEGGAGTFFFAIDQSVARKVPSCGADGGQVAKQKTKLRLLWRSIKTYTSLLLHRGAQPRSARVIVNDELAALLVALLPIRCEICLIVHGCAFYNQAGAKLRLQRYIFEFFLRKRLTRVVFVSNWLEEQVRFYWCQWQGDVTSHVLIDMPIWTGFLEEKIQNVRQPDKWIFVGKLAKSKGLQNVIKTFKLAKKDITTLSLDIYGDGPLREQVQKIIFNEPSISFHGRVTPAEMIRAYDGATVLMHLPNEPESYGLVLREALARGCKVVTNNFGGASLLEGDKNVFFYEADDDMCALLDWVAHTQVNHSGRQ